VNERKHMSMQTEAFLSTNALYLLVAGPLALIIFVIFRFLLKVNTWYLFDLLTLLFPGVLYWLLDMNNINRLLRRPGKSLGNLVELIFIGIGFGLVFLLRGIVNKKAPMYSRAVSLGAFWIMVILTLCVYLLMPSLPE
jgi:hypothetical protein